MAQLNIRIDDTLKEQGEKLFSALGLSFSAAVSVFVSQSVREGGLPFLITTHTDPFDSDSNMVASHQTIQEITEDKAITATIEDIY